MREVSIKDKEIRITSAKAVFAKAASRGFGKNRACSSLFWSRMAHPTGFEPVTSAFGGQGFRLSGVAAVPEIAKLLKIHVI